MKKLVLLSLILASAPAFAVGSECSDMTNTPGIVECLTYRLSVAEKLLRQDFDSLVEVSKRKENAPTDKLMATQKAWRSLRNANCGYAMSGTQVGEEQGITEISCKLAETLKRVHELEDILDAEKTGGNKSFREALNGLVEIREVRVSDQAIASSRGVNIINQEFNAAQSALMRVTDVSGNKLRIKSLRMIDEGKTSVCPNASTYLAELGYFAHKTQKYVKIYVISDVTKEHTIKRIRTSVQENLEDTPVCP